MSHNLREQIPVGQSVRSYGPFGQHGDVIVMTRIAVEDWFVLRAVVFRMKNCCLFPKGPFREQRDHCNVSIDNNIRKFFGSK